MTTTQPVTDAYLAQCEKDAKRMPLMRSTHVTRLVGEVRRLRRPPPPAPPPPVPPLVGEINRQTAALLAGRNPATDRALYLSQDPYTPKFARNPSCWLNGVANITCVSPAQLSGNPWQLRAGTLVTRKHVVYANHFAVPIIDGGTPLLFVQRDNTVVTRRVVAQVADAASDIAIGLLDEEVPAGIWIASVLPADYERHLGARQPFLVVTLDAEEKASVQVCDTLFNGQFSTSLLSASWMPDEWKRLAAWSEATVTGDSGNPVFALIDGELVLLGCWWTAVGGSHLGARHELVGRMLEQLSPGEGYRLTVSRAVG